jgi:putative endonuclease
MVYIIRYYYVYILKCKDNTYYTGITNDMERRLAEHQSGFNPDSYTFSRRPVELVYGEYFNNPNQAINFEKQVKRWSRLKKEALINGDWDRLRFSAECKNHTNYKNKRKSE